MNRNRIAALAFTAIAGAGLLSTSSSSEAAVDPDDAGNRYTFGEFMGSTDAGMARGNVESQWACDCHGNKIRSWYGDDGHRRFQVEYPDTEENSVFITYRFDNFGTPRVSQKMFATDGEGYVVPFS